jgi:class 3 adenylate cyclase
VLERRRFGAVLHRYAELAASSANAASTRAPRLAPGAGDRLARAREELGRLGSPALATRLAELVERGDETAVAALRPYDLAEEWGVPRREALELCLQATRAGLLDLRWELLCPSCRGAKASVAHLSEIEPTIHCDGCHIDFAVGFDRSVEVRFRPNPSIRPVGEHAFCVGGPQLTPHVVAQARLAAGAETVLEPELEPGAHRLRATGARGAVAVDVADDGAGEAWVTLADGALVPDAVAVSTRPRLRVANRTDAPQVVALERTAWSDRAATAAEVTALQLFRDLFASEALRPLEPISVGSLTLLFTDLRASTRFYREIGDATAFGRVMRHIDVVRDAVRAEGGAVVKTMGDAVMAVFTRPLAAIRAALAAQAALRADAGGSPPLHLKVGLHHGPCIAITQDGRLDYFGSTVNAAARLVALASGDDVVCSASVCDDPEVRAALAAGDVAAEGFDAELRGFEGEAFALQRVRAVP